MEGNFGVKNQGSTLVLAVILVFIAVVFMLYIFAWEERRVEEAQGETKLIARDLAQKISREKFQEAIENEWLTYESKDYGYKFKFPTGLAYLSVEGGGPLGSLNSDTASKYGGNLVVGDFAGKQILFIQTFPSSTNQGNVYVNDFVRRSKLDDRQKYWHDATTEVIQDGVAFDFYDYVGGGDYPYNNAQTVYIGEQNGVGYIIQLTPDPLAEAMFATFIFDSPVLPGSTITTTALGFAIDYPEAWTIDRNRSTANEIVFATSLLESRESVRVENSVDSLMDIKNSFVGKFSPEAIKNVGQLTVAGQAAYRIDTSEFGTSYILFKNGDKLYTITTGGRFPLDSFRFIE